MPLKLVTVPAIEPVSLAEAKAHLRVSSSAEDALISRLIEAARQQGENMTGRQFVAAEYLLTLDAFPARRGEIELPRPPLVSVESVKYMDTDGVERTLATTVYAVDVDSLTGRIYLKYDQDWPAARDEKGAVRIAFTTGYESVNSPSVAETPASIKAWILCRVATLFENREQFMDSSRALTDLPRSFIDCLLDPYVVARVV